MFARVISMVLQSHSQSGHLDGLGVGVRDEWVVD